MAITREKFDNLYRDDLSRNLEEILRTVGRKEITDLYLTTYDKLAAQEESEAGSAIKGKDPLSLKNLRGVFENQLNAELSRVVVTSTGIEINLMNKELLGYASTDTPTGTVTTVDILAYYLEGVSGEHAFITPEQYEAGRRGKSRGNSGGRVGGGFMMTKKAYEKEAWKDITGVSFSDVRHPISNQKPFKDFDNLASEINFDKYIKLALEQTNQMLAGQ